MDNIINEFIKWLILNYPIFFLSTGVIFIILLILKEIKEVFFSTDSDGQRFGSYLYHVIFFWTPRKKRKMESKHIQYSNSEREKIVNELLIHNFFVSINTIKIQIPSMEFGNQMKSDALRDIIKIYVETVEKYTMNVLKNYKLDELETSKLNEIFLSEIEKAGFELYSKMKYRLGDELYYKIIEDPVKGFKSRNSIFREVFINGIALMSSQAMSVYDYDNYNRASEILTSMYISLNLIVKNFYKTFKDYNGELDKYFNK